MNKYAVFSTSDRVSVEETVFRACGRKRRFDTEAEAAAQKGQEAYKCPYCDAWHRTGQTGKLMARVRRAKEVAKQFVKFKVTTSATYYSQSRKAKLEKLGFRFEDSGCFSDTPFYKTDHTPEVEISTLRELLDFRNRWGTIILAKGEDAIEIYDGHRE